MRWRILLVCSMSTAASSMSCKLGGGCNNDNDCKGDRVCVGSDCVEPPMKLPPTIAPGAALAADPSPSAAAPTTALPPPTAKSKPRATRQGNTVRFTCTEGGSMVMGQACLCGGTLPVANPCPGKFKLTQEGDACVFTCEDAAKLTCGGCDADCLDKADRIRKSDPAHAQHLASMVCHPDHGCGAADPVRCRSYGFGPR